MLCLTGNNRIFVYVWRSEVGTWKTFVIFFHVRFKPLFKYFDELDAMTLFKMQVAVDILVISSIPLILKILSKSFSGLSHILHQSWKSFQKYARSLSKQSSYIQLCVMILYQQQIWYEWNIWKYIRQVEVPILCKL